MQDLQSAFDELHNFEEYDTDEAPVDLPKGLVAAFRGTQVSAQVYVVQGDDESPIEYRISVRRHDGKRLRHHWRTLQRIREILFPERFAFEAYPPSDQVTDVAPMWHLWVLREGCSLGVHL